MIKFSPREDKQDIGNFAVRWNLYMMAGAGAVILTVRQKLQIQYGRKKSEGNGS